MTKTSAAQKAWATRRARAATSSNVSGNAITLDDSELLTTILSGFREDAAQIAGSLIEEFGSFAEAVSAPVEHLARVTDAAVASHIAAIQSAVTRVLHGKVRSRPVLASWGAVLDYLRAAMAFEDREQFRILFLDKRNQLIADEVQQTGTIDHVSVYPREVVKRALELNATAIILTHNHPSGDPTPSRADIVMTKHIMETCKVFEITVHDHVIVARNGNASMKQMNLI